MRSRERDQLTAMGGDGAPGENRRLGAIATGLDRDPRQ
jgi:hypothetical protein